MSFVAAVVLLALLWGVVTATMTLPNLLLGGALGAAVVYLLRSRLQGTGVGRRSLAVGGLLLVFGRELLLGALRVAMLTMLPGVRDRLRPRFVALPLRVQGDFPITLLANLITLTPGTLSVDVTPDRRALLVHLLHAPDREAAIRELADGLERRLLAVFA